MTDNFALREELAYQIRSWRPAKTFTESLADADTVIASIELPVAGAVPIQHEPIVKWVADAFVVHWDVASAALVAVIQIVMPDMVLIAGRNNSGARLGFRKDSYGYVDPSVLKDGNDILELRLRDENGNFIFKVDGHYPQNEFTSMQIIGQDAALYTDEVDNFDNSGTYTEWKWANTDIALEVGETYAVEFT